MADHNGINILKARLKSLPTGPGVYRMLNGRDEVIYVGKAKNIKHRVSQYTQAERLTTRIRRMVFETCNLEIVETASEAEALLLEANLIKTYMPRYNIRLKDDKSYPGIWLSGHSYPRLQLYRGKMPEKGQFFGPYPNAKAVHQTIDVLERVFQLRTCTDSFFKSRTRPCLKYHVKRCTAPCVNRIDKKDYDHIVKEAAMFLKGQGGKVMGQIQARMDKAAEEMRYEDAAMERDRLKSLSTILGRQRVVTQGLADADILATAMKGGRMCVQLFMYRNSMHVGNARFFPTGIDAGEEAEAFRVFIALHYADKKPPKAIVCSTMPNEAAMLADALSLKSGYKVAITAPSRGDKRKIVEQALHNANNALSRKLSETQSQKKLLQEFAEALGTQKEIKRIEAFDISNIQGQQPVASLVVANEEGMAKSEYRKFTIKGKDTPDDYAMMREALTRRYKRMKEEASADQWPDVVMVDGGKGHLNVLVEVFEELEITGPDAPVLTAIAKGAERDKGLEKIFLHNKAEPLDVPHNTPLIFLLQRIRDEAHRFAIGFHRNRRSKSMLKSALDDVPGIGPKRKKVLLRHFGSVDGVKNATAEELAQVEGVSAHLAEQIYTYFH